MASNSSNNSTELILNRVSMALLVGGGIFFIYEGGVLVDMQRQNPDKIPGKVAVAGTLTILLGIISIGFAIIHLFMDGTAQEFIAKIKQPMGKPKPAATNAANATKASNAAKA